MTTARRKQAMLVFVTVLAIAAGVVIGMVASRLPSRNATAAPPVQSSEATGLAADLNLSPAQSDEMKKIWEAVRDDLRQGFSKAESLQRQRDEEIAGLMTTEQRQQFEKLTKKYANQYDDLQESRRKTFDNAVARTRNLLNDQQRHRYDAILKSRVRPGDGLAFPTGDDVMTTTTATTTPTTQSRGLP